MNDGNISMSMTNEQEQVSKEDKKFLYARAVHSNHLIQYHMQQIIRQQKVVNEYRSIMMEGMVLTPLESNLHKYDPVIILQIIQMIEADNYWHQKTFESVMTKIWRMWNKGIHEEEDASMYSTKTVKWTEWKLLTYAVRARLKLVNNTREKKAQNKKVETK